MRSGTAGGQSAQSVSAGCACSSAGAMWAFPGEGWNLYGRSDMYTVYELDPYTASTLVSHSAARKR